MVFNVFWAVHKIVICEDHDIVVEGVRLILSGWPEFELAGHAHTEAELLPMLAQEQPHILLLDLNLKRHDGFAILEKVRPQYPVLKVIILTMYEDAFLIEKAQKLKANGYLLKNSSNGEMHEALGQVLKSNQFFLPSGLRKQKDEQETYRDEFIEKMQLTAREVEIIRLVAEGKAAQVIADQLFLSLHTVNTHRRNILAKLKLKNIADLVRFAFENHLIKQ